MLATMRQKTHLMQLKIGGKQRSRANSNENKSVETTRRKRNSILSMSGSSSPPSRSSQTWVHIKDLLEFPDLTPKANRSRENSDSPQSTPRKTGDDSVHRRKSLSGALNSPSIFSRVRKESSASNNRSKRLSTLSLSTTVRASLDETGDVPTSIPQGEEKRPTTSNSKIRRPRFSLGGIPSSSIPQSQETSSAVRGKGIAEMGPPSFVPVRTKRGSLGSNAPVGPGQPLASGRPNGMDGGYSLFAKSIQGISKAVMSEAKMGRKSLTREPSTSQVPESRA